MQTDLADEEFKAWLENEGYYALRDSPLGIIGLRNFIYTCGIAVGIGQWSYRYRFCFPTLLEAVGALDEWAAKNYTGEPEGYLVRKGEGGDRRGPGTAKRMIADAAAGGAAQLVQHFLWRDLSSDFHPLDSMEIPSVHCALRLLWNHQAPVPVRLPYVEAFDEIGPGAWALDSFYTPDYCSVGIVAMVRNLLARTDLPEAVRRDVLYMQSQFATALTPIGKQAAALEPPAPAPEPPAPQTAEEWRKFGYDAYYAFMAEHEQKPSVSFIPAYKAPEGPMREAVLTGWFEAKEEN